MNDLYSVSRIRKNSDDLYGKIHGAVDARVPSCDIDMESKGQWYILSNTFEDLITCKKCKEQQQAGDVQLAHATRSTPIALGTKTQWGAVEAVGVIGGERFYWMVDSHQGVSMIPASVLEGTAAQLNYEEDK